MSRIYLVSRTDFIWDEASNQVNRIKTELLSYGWFFNFEECWDFAKEVAAKDNSTSLFSVSIVEQHGALKTAELAT